MTQPIKHVEGRSEVTPEFEIQYPEFGDVEKRLLNDFQHGFPLAPRPYAAIAQRLGVTEQEVLERLRALSRTGALSRIGAVVRPRALGASTLAAMGVPPVRLPEVAGLVNGYAEVNHNYERENRLNLWFVAAAASEARLAAVLEEIERRSGIPVLSLPMLEDYHIDLGFDLCGGPSPPCRYTPRKGVTPVHGRTVPDENDRRLLAAIQHGLPLSSRPYAEAGAELGLGEAAVIERLQDLIARGTIKRFGVVVRHHELGYTANAMVVWDVADEETAYAGGCLSRFDFVTLCYRRARRLPDWPYNLYCMIHGTSRDAVREKIACLIDTCGLEDLRHEVLFSRRRFKQRGPVYAGTEPERRPPFRPVEA